MLEVFLWVCLVVGVLYGCDLLLLAMEAKGWIYYRKVKRSGAGLGDILTGADVLTPGASHLHQARQEHALEEEDNGDDDGERKPADRVS